MGELEADKGLLRQKPCLITPLNGGAQETRIYDPVHLAQRHARNGGRFISCHECVLVYSHRTIQILSIFMETYITSVCRFPVCSQLTSIDLLPAGPNRRAARSCC